MEDVQIISLKDTCALTSMSKTMILRFREDGAFPLPVSLGEKRIAFSQVRSRVVDTEKARREDWMTQQADETELYRAYDENERLLYIGISLSAISRALQHKANSGWFGQLRKLTVEKHETREGALAAERKAIISEKPQFNIVFNRSGATRSSAQRSFRNYPKAKLMFTPPKRVQPEDACIDPSKVQWMWNDIQKRWEYEILPCAPPRRQDPIEFASKETEATNLAAAARSITMKKRRDAFSALRLDERLFTADEMKMLLKGHP